MKNKILFLRICFYCGAVFDSLMLFPMLFPNVGGFIFGISNFNPWIDYKFAMGIGTSLMAGWTFLLLWAAIKPVERRTIFIMTVFPVLSGLIISGIYAVESGLIGIKNMLPVFIMQILFITLYIYAYSVAKNIESDETSANNI